MIKICVADNYPVAHYGIKSYLSSNSDLEVVADVYHYAMVKETLRTRPIDILVMDLDLKGLTSIYDIKKIIKEYPKTKVIVFTDMAENLYAQNAFKMGALGYIHKSEKMDVLANAISDVNSGQTIMNDTIRDSIASITTHRPGDRMKRLSTREIEVLRYISTGKKNNEIATILQLNEKTISTYKLRIQNKLNVTNVVDLINKANIMELI